MPSPLTAGYAIADITPPLGLPMAGYGSRDKVSEGVADPLSAQALVLESQGAAAAIICADLIGLDREVVVAVREQAAALTGLPAENIMFCASHTHWGPIVSGGKYMPEHLRACISPDYRNTLVKTLAGLIASAKQSLAPVTIGYGAGFAGGITFNRRSVGPDFKTEMHLVLPPVPAAAATREGNRLAQEWQPGQHKGPRLSQPLPEIDGKRVGPADAQVTVLRLQREDGQPLVGLVNFACHAVCGGGDFYHYSADWPGQARQAFEAVIGAPMMYASGCSGDQVPRWRQNDARTRVGRSCGAEAARTWLAIDEATSDAPLRVASETVNLPLNPRIRPVEEARTALAAHADPDSTNAVFDRHMLSMAEEAQAKPEGHPGEVWAMALGELAIVGLPGEVLTEIGLQIKQRSPFPYTMVVSLANDCIGYLPTDDACCEGGYETEWSPIGPGTERALVETSLRLLESL